jgi:hypothetical protein
VQHQQVHFLDARRPLVRDADVDVGLGQEFPHPPAGVAGERHDRHLARVRRVDRGQHVGRVAARGEGEQHVAGRAQRRDLLGEDDFVAVVVADRGEDRGVDGEGDRGEARALALEPADELGREVLGVGRRAAVAAHQDLAPAGDAADQRTDRVGDRLAQHFGSGVLEVGAVEKLLLDPLFEHGHR